MTQLSTVAATDKRSLHMISRGGGDVRNARCDAPTPTPTTATTIIWVLMSALTYLY